MITMNMRVSEVQTKANFLARSRDRLPLVEVSAYLTIWGEAGECRLAIPYDGYIPKVGETVTLTIAPRLP